MSEIRIQFERHPFWNDVLKVVDTLKEHGFQALLVGGCVRDALIGRELKDFDVVTDAIPDEVEKIFPNSISIGKAFGVITVPVAKSFQVEIATFRADGEYDSNRHPLGVTYSDMTEDAARRDFTINALYLDPVDGEMHDLHGGIKDLEARVIRAIGNPVERFQEDPLRVLRALRFASQLGFKIEAGTLAAVKQEGFQLKRVSRERVYAELKSLFKGTHWIAGVELLKSTGIWEEVFGSRVEIESEDLKKISTDAGWIERFLWCYEGEEFQKISKDLRSIKVSTEEYKTAEFLRTKTGSLLGDKERLGVRLQLLESAPLPETLNYIAGYSELTGAPLKKFESLRKEYLKVSGGEANLPAPFLTGQDLLAMGLKQGPELGKMRAEIYLLQLEGALTSKTQAEAKVRELRI